jgi:hypothetical protein
MKQKKTPQLENLSAFIFQNMELLNKYITFVSHIHNLHWFLLITPDLEGSHNVTVTSCNTMILLRVLCKLHIICIQYHQHTGEVEMF